MNFLTKFSMDNDSAFQKRLILAVLFTACFFAMAWAQGDQNLFPPKPEPAVYVHDYAGWLSSGDKMGLEQKLRQYWDSTSTQIVVMIRPDIGGYDKASYAIELGNRWGIGGKDKDNGILLLIKSEGESRGAFIATGQGTEGALPDITAGRIIRNTMIPYFRQQQYAQGINAGVDDIIRAMSGEFKNDHQNTQELSFTEAMLIVLFAFLMIFAFMAYIRYKIRNGTTMYSNDGRRMHRRGGDLGGGGWWIGGGGSSGGWGDSGGGDGGSFGGGSFGGGGAGGDW